MYKALGGLVMICLFGIHCHAADIDTSGDTKITPSVAQKETVQSDEKVPSNTKTPSDAKTTSTDKKSESSPTEDESLAILADSLIKVRKNFYQFFMGKNFTMMPEDESPLKDEGESEDKDTLPKDESKPENKSKPENEYKPTDEDKPKDKDEPENTSDASLSS